MQVHWRAKATSGESPQKALPNGKKRRLVHPWNRLEPATADRAIHASLHFCGLTPEVATDYKGKPVKPHAP
jgi:hypothetical protein